MRHGGVWRGKKTPLVTREAKRFRAADFPITRQRAWGGADPIVHCDACGTVPVPLDQLPVRLPEDLEVTAEGNALLDRPDFLETRVPVVRRARRSARRTRSTATSTPPRSSTRSRPRRPTAASRCSRTPSSSAGSRSTAYINGADTGSFVLDQRTTTKMLRDLGYFTWLPDGECYRRTYTHEMVQLDGRKMSKHLGNTITPQAIVEQVGADALRFATLYAAAPAKAFTWDDSLLTYSRSFLRRLWNFAEPRVSGRRAELDLDDGLRRRLAGWCDTAVAKIDENYMRLDMHRATRNLVSLLERIEDFEAQGRGPSRALGRGSRGRRLRVCGCCIQLLAPVAPHMAQELWARVRGRRARGARRHGRRRVAA